MYDPILCMNVPDSVKIKDSKFEKVIDKATRSIDGISEIRRAIGLLKNAMSVLGPASETQQIVRDIQNVISKLENID